MRIIIQKYGGSSVSDLDKIRGVAARIAASRAEGAAVVAAVAVDSSLSCMCQQGSWWSGWSSSPQSDTVAKRESWWPQKRHGR
jgi:aspartokinase